jgi:hypothetical protein
MGNGRVVVATARKMAHCAEKSPTVAKTARIGHPTSKAQSAAATLLQEAANRVYNAGNLFAGS